MAIAAVILIATHLIGPKRHGRVKDSTYESGVDPIADARRRFNVRFYLVAVLFLVFDVEIIFLYPWAVLFPQFNAREPAGVAADVLSLGYTPAFFVVSILVFFALLTVGFVYEWRKGIFQWDR
ncbi:MAG: NADH-quinone oxidoreductase subunit A [Planctomycetota bacterium]|nr:MAG: NADH-quinone oxidoreductase subunit A [Planctomycetota bacterium]